MSLHAQLTPEAANKLQENRRNSSIASIFIALLTCVLLATMLAFILLKNSSDKVSGLVEFVYQKDQPDILKTPLPTNDVPRRPTPPSSMSHRFISSMNVSSFSIKSPQVNTPELSLDLGTATGDDSGYEIGSDSGSGSPSNGYGSTAPNRDTIAGHLYDFKQTSTGREVTDYNTSDISHFTSRINSIQRARFKDSAFRRYYKTPQALHVRYIAIPLSSATDGPKFFNAEDKVKPSGWLVHYSGKLKVPTSGEFRLVGSGDDYIGVAINNKMRLAAAWPDIASSITARGANASEQPNYKGPFNVPLTYGEWFTLREGDTIDVDVAIGERPGGDVGFVLMLEKKGEVYEQAPDGRKILPPFVFGQLDLADLTYFENFPGWQWNTDKILMFRPIN